MGLHDGAEVFGHKLPGGGALVNVPDYLRLVKDKVVGIDLSTLLHGLCQSKDIQQMQAVDPRNSVVYPVANLLNTYFKAKALDQARSIIAVCDPKRLNCHHCSQCQETYEAAYATKCDITATFSTTLQLIWRGVPVTKFKASTALRWPSASGTLCGHSPCISSFIPSFLPLFFVYFGAINASRVCINSFLHPIFHSFNITANHSLFDTLYSYLHVGCTDDYSLLVQALAGVAFQVFDVDSTGKHEKEYDRARKMQQDGHVIPSALTVTCGTVTNLGGINGTLFAVQVVPSQRTQAPCVCVCVWLRSRSRWSSASNANQSSLWLWCLCM